MIQYVCTYKDEKWFSSLEVIEENDKYSILQIQNKFNNLKVFLWHNYDEFYLGIPSYSLTCALAYPTDEFWNYESLYHHTEDEILSKTISVGLSTYYGSRKDIRTMINN